MRREEEGTSSRPGAHDTKVLNATLFRIPTIYKQMQVQHEKRVRKATVRFQAPVAILKKKTKRSPAQVKHNEAAAAANAIKRQEAIEESEQAASRLFDEVRVFVFLSRIRLITALNILYFRYMTLWEILWG